MDKKFLSERINGGFFDKCFEKLYSASDVPKQRKRYINAIRRFGEIYPDREDVFVFSAPGRTEIGGNHTDHQHGCVLAAAVNLDVIAVVSFHSEGVVRVKSEGYEQDIVELSDLSADENERGKSSALIRGVCARFAEKGVKIGGFDAYTTSDVLSGSGMSSSAAFEVLIGTIISRYYRSGASAIEIAKIG